MKQIRYFVPGLILVFSACNQGDEKADAYGNFEAVEVMVSAEGSGRIMKFDSGEGERLTADQPIAIIDTTQLFLKKSQLNSGGASIVSRINTLEKQVLASKVNLANLEREKERIDHLVEGGAATSKQLDDINGQIELLKAQIKVTESQKSSLLAEQRTHEIQIRQVEDQINKCTVRSPMDGIMLTKYREQGEVVVPGQVLFKMAHLDDLILRAYVTGSQLSQVKVGAKVRVRFDVSDGMQEIEGTVNWISPQAEFTPKIIQTKEERVSLVYAIKVAVPNDGRLKIGMPGELLF
jgi:HlyD family secretion protein